MTAHVTGLPGATVRRVRVGRTTVRVVTVGEGRDLPRPGQTE